jgi:hypothetical protein
MNFMVTWRTHTDKRHDSLQAWSKMTAEDHAGNLGDKVKLIGRWHDLVRFTGVAILETDDPIALSEYILKWNAILDADLAVVVDDEEARRIGRDFS